MKNIIIYLGIFLLLIAGCDDQEVKEEDLGDFQKLEWLQGIWEGQQGEAQLYESWRRKSFRIIEGISYTTVGSKRVYSQDMRIEQSNNKIYFILKKEPGGEAEIRLELSSINDSTAEFVNPEEGFPQKILYSRQKKERMSVALSGPEGEETETKMSYRKTEDFSEREADPS